MKGEKGEMSEMIKASRYPRMSPKRPPRQDRTRDSKRNWRRILRLLAPTALRIPISRERSETETSMIFMTPMPPTSRETTATRESMPEMRSRSEPEE